MRIDPKRMATLYFRSWWLPFVAAFFALIAFLVLYVVVMAFTFANYLGIMATVLLILLVFSLLGILIAAIWNLVKKRWAKGLVNLLVMLPLFIIAALFSFGFLLVASIAICPYGAVGQEIVIPRDAGGEAPRVKVALMLQNYDPWDTGFCGYFVKLLWKSFLEMGGRQYSINFNLTVLSEHDIISGKLKEDDFDVLIGPGGSGTWHAQAELRERIRTYISNGGNYLGICGDAAFGTLGFVNVSPRLEKVFLRQTAKTPSLEPFLQVANVYTDLIAIDRLSSWRINTLLLKILFSPVRVRFLNAGPQDALAGQVRKVNWAFMMAVPGMKDDLPLPHIDAVYADDWLFPKGSLKGKAIHVSTTYGKGRVILSGLHAEFNRRTYDIVISDILWLTNLQSRAPQTNRYSAENTDL